MDEVAYQNKDITSKLFAESLKEKSFAAYGVNTPKIKEIWPTNLPRIAANELRMDEDQKVSAIAGIVTFSDKIISKEYSDHLKEWIRMTKVGRLFEEEKIEAVKRATEEVTKETKAQLVQNAYDSLGDIQKVAQLLKLSEEEVREFVGQK